MCVWRAHGQPSPSLTPWMDSAFEGSLGLGAGREPPASSGLLTAEAVALDPAETLRDVRYALAERHPRMTGASRSGRSLEARAPGPSPQGASAAHARRRNTGGPAAVSAGAASNAALGHGPAGDDGHVAPSAPRNHRAGSRASNARRLRPPGHRTRRAAAVHPDAAHDPRRRASPKGIGIRAGR